MSEKNDRTSPPNSPSAPKSAPSTSSSSNEPTTPNPPPLPPPMPPPPPQPMPSFPVSPGVSQKSSIHPVAAPQPIGPPKTKKEQVAELCKRQFDNEGFHMTNKLLLSFFDSVTPVLQEGPSCGLAALCMAGQLLKTKDGQPHNVNLNDLLVIAREKGYTNHGEMYSAANMRQLAADVFHCDAELLDNGMDDNARIMKHLMCGKPILVPYDTDANHRPCCKKGHKAHWAVLTGVVLVVPSNLSHLLVGSFTQDPSFQPLQHSNASVETFDFRGCIANMFLYAWQGKSLHPALWLYTDLLLSNDNLMELGEERQNATTPFLVPADGVQGGLCRKVILLKNSEPLP